MKVTKWSINSGESNVSDQQPESVNGETGTAGTRLGAGSTVPNTSVPGEPEAATAVTDTQPLRLVDDKGETSLTVDAPKIESAGAEAPKVEAVEVEAKKVEAPKV